ncbi:MAG: SDR family NAD(P)-dependent oxidoreductase [Hyphomicrobiaceae bacterium]
MMPVDEANELKGRVALVTGAAGGMGRAHAVMMAGKGAAVAIQDINAKGIAETAAMIEAKGGRALQFAFDVADTRLVGEMVRETEGKLGRLDILVNNAGIGSNTRLEDASMEFFDRTFAVHVMPAFQAVKAALPGMKQRRMGKIINISSRWALVGNEFASDYCAAKAAMLGLTKAWAKELAPWNICVNAVAPGGVWSQMALEEKSGAEGIREAEKKVPLGRWAQPEEIAHLVTFLASPRSDFITGQVVSPNGGASIVGF